MKVANLNLKIPKSYRRDFHLFFDGCRHKIEVRGRKVAVIAASNNPPVKYYYHGLITAWVQESMESVRMEFETKWNGGML